MQRDEDSKQAYKEPQREANKEVAKANNNEYEELCEGLDTKDGDNT